jgi:histidinol-phosphate aminotransferase
MSDITQLMRKHLVEVTTYSGVDPSEELARSAGIRPEDVIRLNANENPHGAPIEVVAALADLPLHEYPDPEQRELRKALSAYTDQPVERLIAGAGGDEIIDLLLRLFVEPGDKVIDCEPTFGMYGFCARIAAAEVVSLPRNDDWSIDLGAIRSAIDVNTKIVFIASPNNPTGNSMSEAEAVGLLETGLIVAIDETYYEFSGTTLAHLAGDYENLVILRSFSKWAGIAGLRVGYAIGSEILVRHLMDIKQPYNINVAAAAAAKAALNASERLLAGAQSLIEQRRRIERAVDGIDGMTYYESDGNFLLCRFDNLTAREAYEYLARRGIFVRLFSYPRLEKCLRISAGTPEQTDRVIEALQELPGS